MQELFIKFIKFGVVGLSGVGVDFGITWIGKEKLNINQYVANSCGFMAAVVSNYILNRLWTFHSTDPSIALQFGKFLLVALLGLGMNNAIIYVLNEQRGVKFYPAKLAATGIVMIWNFGANYFFTFHT